MQSACPPGPCLLSPGMEQPKKEKKEDKPARPVMFVYIIDGHQAGAGAAGRLETWLVLGSRR